jgi:PAS domain S-box-containing protein
MGLNSDMSFIGGGGEMGELTRRHNWSETSIGSPENWPQSLRTTLSIILSSRFPMFLFWGPDLTCFYNDAFRPSLGNNGKHPSILGAKGADGWAEIWAVIKPLIDQVLSGGEATWSEDQLIPIYRNGKIEDVYWTFSYSPVNDESGKPAGVFVTCTETTEKVINLQKISESKDELSFAIEATELGTFDFNPATAKFSANERLKNWFGHYPTEEIELSQALAAIAEGDRQRVSEAINRALEFDSGGKFDIIYTIVHPQTKKETVVHAKGRSWFNDLGEPYRFNGTLQDITHEYQVRRALDEKERKLSESERHLKSIIIQAPFAIALFRGPEYIVEMVNDRSLELWGRMGPDVIGKPIFESMPELVGQGIQGLVDHVYNTGEIFSATEFPVEILRNEKMQTAYVNFTYEPLYDIDHSINGIMAVGVEVTQQVISRQVLEKLIEEQKASEETLNIIIDASELGTWELDLVRGVMEYSDRYREIFGYMNGEMPKHEEMISHLHPQDLLARNKAMEEAFRTGLYYGSRLIWPDNSLHWIEVQGKVFYDEDKKPLKLIGTVRDVTEARKQQQILQESEKKFRVLADSMPQFVWTAEVTGVLNYFNRAVYAYSGLSEEKVNKDGWLQIVHPEERERNITEWMKSVESGNDFIFEHRFRRQDGQYRWQLSRAIPQRDEAGKIQMWVGTSTDIEDQKSFASELERLVQERTNQLAQKNLELEYRNKELQSFTYVSSHDLQEPLRKIQTFSDRLLESDQHNLSDEGKNSVSRMVYAAERMRKLIDDLLAYSRIASGKQVFEKTDLKEILSEVQEDLSDEIKKKNARIETHGLTGLSAIRFQFVQLFQNLLSNSLKFYSLNRPPHIVITQEAVPGGILIKVQDNGIGFEPEYGEKIFELFQRLHGIADYGGTGVGLAIVKRIVDNHKGEIKATAAPDQGALFSMFFPKSED